jgi:hypothetical protein
MATIDIISTANPVIGTLYTGQLPFTYNDTLTVGYPISFAFNLSYLNELRQNISASTITSNGINSNQYSLQVFLCQSIDGSNNLINVSSDNLYSLSSTDLTNNFLSKNISNSFFSTQEDLGFIMTQTEVMQLCKEYKIVLRITSSSSPNTTRVVQNGDIVHDLKLMLDVQECGPYETEFSNINLLDKSDYTEAEWNNIFQINFPIVGNHNLRAYYPSNYKSLSSLPIISVVHGQNHNGCMYDAYLQHFASYGYFAYSTIRELNYIGSGTRFGGYTRQATTLYQLKSYISKISKGKYNGILNFNKIIIFGHSFGGADCGNFQENLKNYIPTPQIPGLTYSDIIGGIALEGSGTPLADTNGPLIYVSSASCRYSSVNNIPYNYSPLMPIAYRRNPSIYMDGGIVLNYGSHEDVAYPFSAANNATEGASLLYNNLSNLSYSRITTKLIPLNNYDKSLTNTAGFIVKLLSQNYYSKIKNSFTNTSNQYKPTILAEKDYCNTNYFRWPLNGINGITFIDDLKNTSKFTTNISTSDYFIVNNNNGIVPVDTTSYTSTTAINLYKNPLNSNETFGTKNSNYWENGTYVFPYNSTNLNINYNFANNLNLSGNSYIGFPIGIIYSAIIQSQATSDSEPNVLTKLTNSLYQHFIVELSDLAGNSAWISSKQNNMGMIVPVGKTNSTTISTEIGQVYLTAPNNTTTFQTTAQDSILENIHFKISDFKQQNSNLNLSTIRGLKILFGPDKGISGDVGGRIMWNGIFLV